MGTCPHCGADVLVRAELVPPDAFDDDNVAMAEDGAIRLEHGSRVFQYVCPECDAVLGAGTHKWAR